MWVLSQQKLNLCPSPLIKLNYLEGMKKKKHWDGSGSLLLVPIPSPAPTEWEFVAVRPVWFRSRLEEPMPCTRVVWSHLQPRVLSPGCFLNSLKRVPGPERAPELFKRMGGLRSKQTEASISDLGQRHSVTCGEIPAGSVSLIQGYWKD